MVSKKGVKTAATRVAAAPPNPKKESPSNKQTALKKAAALSSKDRAPKTSSSSAVVVVSPSKHVQFSAAPVVLQYSPLEPPCMVSPPRLGNVRAPTNNNRSDPPPVPPTQPMDDDALFRLVEHRKKNQQINPEEVKKLSYSASSKTTATAAASKGSASSSTVAATHHHTRTQAFTIFDIPVIIDTRALSLTELRAELKARGLRANGPKQLLQKRLEDYIEEFEKQRAKEHSGRTSIELKSTHHQSKGKKEQDAKKAHSLTGAATASPGKKTLLKTRPS